MGRLSPLTRLRLAFAGLGVLLLTPLSFLLESIDDRLEAQRRLRHEIVAQRIFDELERELTRVLEQEGERPSAAYDADATSVETWAPFVVGYFKTSSGGVELLGASQLDPGRRNELAIALERWRRPEASPAPPTQARELEEEPGAPGALGAAVDAGAEAAPMPPEQRAVARPRRKEAAVAAGEKPKTSPEVLRQLNRSVEERQKAAPKSKRDPFTDAL